MMDKEKARKIPVESIGRGGVSYRVPSTRIKRRWDRPGIIKMIDTEEIKEIFYDEGMEMLFTVSLLIKDTELREELGLPVSATAAMSNKDMVQLLEAATPKFKSIANQMSRDSLIRLADLAVENGLDNMSKVQILKKLTGIDVYKRISDKEEEIQARKKQE